jgi:RNA polymerase sigma factor (sigma-70 family)
MVHAYADPDAASAGDRAFEELYRRYVKDVYRYTLAVLRNPADAEDVTQITFLNAYRAYKRGDEPLKPQHWLIKIAHNACRSRYVRASRRPREVPLDESLVQIAEPDGVDVDGLLAALAELPFRQRAALVMRELDGRSYREIAETLEVTVPAVETLIFRARRRLRADRSALRALSAVPLPPSLVSFVEGGGGVAGGSALLGTGLGLKAALLVVAGVVAGGVATESFKATAAPSEPQRVTALRGSAPGSLAPAGVRGVAGVTASLTLTRTSWAQTAASGASRGLPAARVDVRGARLPGGAGHAGTVTLGRPSEVGASAPGTDAPAGQASVAPASAPASSSSSKPSAPSAPVGVSAPAPPPSASSTVDTTTSAVSSAVDDATAPVAAVTVPAVPTVPPPSSVIDTVTSLVPPPPKLP